MGHDHHHRHGAGHLGDARYLVAALTLLGAFLVAEIVVAFWSGSLALLSDAGHMLSDVGAIAAALWAARLATRPHTSTWTYGLKRAEILSAAANGVTLLVVAGIILVEAIRRIVNGTGHIDGASVLVVALIGGVINVAAAAIMAKANRASLNVEGAYQHPGRTEPRRSTRSTPRSRDKADTSQRRLMRHEVYQPVVASSPVNMAQESIVLLPFRPGLPITRVDLPRTAADREEVWDALSDPYGRHARPSARLAIPRFYRGPPQRRAGQPASVQPPRDRGHHHPHPAVGRGRAVA